MNKTPQEQKTIFCSKCDEVIGAKFLMGTYRLNELLRSLAALPDAVRIIGECMENFDYVRMQERCFAPSPDGSENKGVLVLPDSDRETVAFLFCLLMDVDERRIDFSALLQTFFMQDGSFTQAYERFCAETVLPFERALLALWAEPKSEQAAPTEWEAPAVYANKKEAVKALQSLLAESAEALNASELAEEHKRAGNAILKEMSARLSKRDYSVLPALSTGYTYFRLATNYFDKRSQNIAAAIEATL